MTTEKILEAIREANPELRELRKGIKFRWKSLLRKFSGVYTVVDIESFSKSKMTLMCVKDRRISTRSIEDIAKFDERIYTDKCFKIIGHEPELRHLLITANNCNCRTAIYTFANNRVTFNAFRDSGGFDIETPYDLTKSVRENLDTNKDLRELLTNLL